MADPDAAELISVAAALARLPPEALEQVPSKIRVSVLEFDVPLGGSAA